MSSDRELIDALCRLQCGWSAQIPGDEQDFRAAHQLVYDRNEKVRGTFAPTAEARLRAALSDLVGGMKSLNLADKLPGPFRRAEKELGL